MVKLSDIFGVDVDIAYKYIIIMAFYLLIYKKIYSM